MVRGFETFATERQLKKLTGNFDIESAKQDTPESQDDDYIAKNDVPWIRRFAHAGGRIIISGNTNMRNVPHERLALIENGMIVIFFESRIWRSSSLAALSSTRPFNLVISAAPLFGQLSLDRLDGVNDNADAEGAPRCPLGACRNMTHVCNGWSQIHTYCRAGPRSPRRIKPK